MNSSSLRKQHGSIHRIREFDLEKVSKSFVDVFLSLICMFDSIGLIPCHFYKSQIISHIYTI